MKTLPVTRSAIPQLRATSAKSYSSRNYRPFFLLHFPPYKLPFFCLLFSKDPDQLAKSSWLEVTQPRARKQEESRFFYSSGLVKICKAWAAGTLGDVLCYAFNFPEEGYKCTWVSRRKFIGSVIFICLVSALMEKKVQLWQRCKSTWTDCLRKRGTSLGHPGTFTCEHSRQPKSKAVRKPAEGKAILQSWVSASGFLPFCLAFSHKAKNTLMVKAINNGDNLPPSPATQITV